VVLVAAGAAYVADTFAHALLSNYADYADAFVAVVAVIAVIAEFAFMAWLLFRAGRSDSTTAQSDGPGSADGSIDRTDALV
jgi:hypothetical protein